MIHSPSLIYSLFPLSFFVHFVIASDFPHALSSPSTAHPFLFSPFSHPFHPPTFSHRFPNFPYPTFFFFLLLFYPFRRFCFSLDLAILTRPSSYRYHPPFSSFSLFSSFQTSPLPPFPRSYSPSQNCFTTSEFEVKMFVYE